MVAASRAAVNALSAVLDALERDGYAITDTLIDRPLAESLRREAGSLHADGVFTPAGVGAGHARERHESTRTDHIHWLDASASPIQHAYLGALEQLRLAINEKLMLGLFDLECHYACYAPGGYYRPHLDRFQRDSRRVMTAVLYLNEEWAADDGGALRLYLGDAATGEFLDVLPSLGTLALFLSGRYWHEVLPARRQRYAVTGWFRSRA